MTQKTSLFIVSGTREVRTAAQEVLAPLCLAMHVESTAAGYLARAMPPGPSCVVADTDLPDMSGIELLEKVGRDATFIMLTCSAEIGNSVRAMRAGAFDYLSFPLDRSALLRSVSAGLVLDQERCERRMLREDFQRRFQTLTRRERETAALLVRGWMNKLVAAELGISIVTVQIHRGSIMRKMGAKSLPELVRMMDMLGFVDPTFAERVRVRAHPGACVRAHAPGREWPAMQAAAVVCG